MVFFFALPKERIKNKAEETRTHSQCEWHEINSLEKTLNELQNSQSLNIEIGKT